MQKLSVPCSSGDDDGDDDDNDDGNIVVFIRIAHTQQLCLSLSRVLQQWAVPQIQAHNCTHSGECECVFEL